MIDDGEKREELNVGETYGVIVPSFPDTAPSYFAWKIAFTGGDVLVKNDSEEGGGEEAEEGDSKKKVVVNADQIKIRPTEKGIHTLGFIPATEDGDSLGAEARALYDPPTYEFEIQ